MVLGYKDKGKQLRVQADKRGYTGRMRIRTGLQMRDATMQVQAAIPSITFPFVVFHGTGDVITRPEISIRLFDGAASSDKSLYLYEGAYHCLYWDTDAVKSTLMGDIIAWLDARIGLVTAAHVEAPVVLPSAASTISVVRMRSSGTQAATAAAPSEASTGFGSMEGTRTRSRLDSADGGADRATGSVCGSGSVYVAPRLISATSFRVACCARIVRTKADMGEPTTLAEGGAGARDGYGAAKLPPMGGGAAASDARLQREEGVVLADDVCSVE